ncbi:She1p [Lachancea thermotolerans CBS 6340]|uniref:KLTH0E14498p n=1 Tax=Lachancea thermotolerans (strain ATCC 56472 / CBS 6340 / NRRL Y-8284) TaxID=559295 RepID=C5DIR1_LACTC|nr:KLTH0E14498p [Lachancea thermotolerans CBS 6340]CAR23672.1 KLTH0E14498p [Lachancea thermotolerans CBS 6340]
MAGMECTPVSDAGMEYHDQVIDNLGVSKRLGNSVLSELDLRATDKASSLGPRFEDAQPHTAACDRFEIMHQTEFGAMQSIGSHYAAHKYPVAETSGISQGATDEGGSAGEDEIPGTPKRAPEQNLQSSNKRLRDRNGKSRESDSFVFSPVSDITRRIRRLRVRNQTPRENRSNVNRVRNTPLSGVPPPKISFDRQQATFAKPTFTSINRETRPGAIFSKLKKPDSKPNKFAPPSTPSPAPPLPQLSSRSAELLRAKDSTKIKDKATKNSPSTAHNSVFQRLYEQTTISRSNSSNTIATQKKTIRKSQTMKNLRQESRQDTSPTPTPVTSSVTRSKSSYTLSTRDKSNEKIPRSTSTSMSRPVWR